MSRTNISSGSKFEAEIAYSRAVVTGDWILVSGTTGYNYDTGVISSDVAEQTAQTLRTLRRHWPRPGASMADVVRVQYTLPDRDDFPKTWPVLREWFGEVRPAATMVQAGLMKDEMKIEIEVTARRTGTSVLPERRNVPDFV
ncbi:endoribonuclease L-PSP [Verticillium alfalfae VaMs.102]|uniref:Endoribonuclease L-PSP n=1 Tax=Verticillium alfalfae (strain VaMs.102 / ATCC MYA-4576 / FGSC 10136) TaxID=526221 RepID=C9SJA1_VERA1|nr:endoribonuclease L-PSP [Verticillium alfalfae VaMs.102]EEY18263.1 endoribonuclease L-PSP [Verticillium alfalfae VaMs.102]